MKKSTRIIFFVIGFGLFGYLIWSFGFDNIVSNIRKTGIWFLPIIGIWLVVYLLNAYAWYIIVRNPPRPDGHRGTPPEKGLFLEIFTISLSSFAINYVTPLVNLGGESYRVLASKETLGVRRAVSSTLMYNMLHMMSHIYLWIVGAAFLFFILPLDKGFVLSVSLFILILVFLLIFFYSRYRQGIFKSALRILSKVKILKSLYLKLQKKENTLYEIDEEIKYFYSSRRKEFYYALVLEFAARVIASLEFYFILYSIGTDVDFFQAFYIYAASSLLLNILFFMPMEIGAREGSLYLVMESLQLSSGIGIYAALVNRIREFFWILVGLVLIQLSGYKKSAKPVLDYLKTDVRK
jgi:uncharacterized protein (TIRG00374 family)